MDILIEIFSHAGISTNTIWYFSIIISIVGFYVITLMDILIEIFSHAGISTNTIWYFSIIISIVGFT